MLDSARSSKERRGLFQRGPRGDEPTDGIGKESHELLELANGYWELDNASELAQRLENERGARESRSELVHDQHFSAAMQSGLGNCAGVAVGFDRVVMLALGLDSVAETLAFPWARA